MNKQIPHPISNIWNKIESKKDLKVNDVLCFWSDLLGFGNVFFDNNWQIDLSTQRKIYDRLINAHSTFLKQTIPLTEKSLILNDGLVKVATINSLTHPDLLGIFLRSCVWTHIEINKIEAETNYPGCRSILSFGQNIEYIEEEIKLDDYVYNYTKPDPSSLSTLATQMGNPTMVYNPAPFQMNTAFSKSYILDSLGSKYGIKGNKLYIDQSVIDFSKDLAKTHKVKYKEIQDGNLLKILILKSESHPSFGFEFDDIIDIDYKKWKTKVYRVKTFYPHDEDMQSFQIEL